MARIVETEQKKKKVKNKKKFIIAFIVVLILVCGLLGWKLLSRDSGRKQAYEIKELDNLKEFGYTLTDSDSDLFKTEFKELKSIVNADEIDEEKYTTQVAKMFVIDLYTMSTKVNKYDIGGIEYFYFDKKDMYEQKVMDTLYSALQDNTYGDRKQELPEVSGVEVLSNIEGKFKIGTKESKSRIITLNISYVKDLGYDKEATITLCKENELSRWSVVDFQPTIKK